MRRVRVLMIIGAALVLALVAARSAAAPAPKVSNVTAAPSPTLAGHAAKYTITFTTSASGALVTGNTITVKFPAGTVPGLTCGNVGAFASNVTVNGVATSVSSIVSCLEVRVTVPAGAGIGNSSNVTVVMGSSSNVIKNPGAGSKTLKVHTTKDLTDVKSAAYVIAPQTQPVANGQAVSTDEDVAKLITLTGSDADGDPLTFFISVVPSHGTLGPIGAPTCTGLVPNVCSADVTYTPAADYNGPDSFNFRVNDGVVNSVAAGGAVSITVDAVADAPVAVDDATTVLENSGVSTIAVLANDSDADGDPLTIVSNTAAANGTAACGPSSCTYMPNPGFDGSDQFDYTIDDGTGLTDTATVFVEVTPVGGPASFDLCAKENPAWTLVGSTTVPIWGFALGDCSGPDAATLPGPQLDGIAPGDEVSITLHNSLSENVSLEFPGQNEPPDPVGTPPGEQKTYTFTAGGAGTYLYESANNRQALMGLYGALIIGDASAYDAEGVLVLSEVDPAFNAAPMSFNLLNYAPKYWLINGKSYPDTAPIVAAAGDDVLLRYLNAGNVHHTMALLGLHQRVVARDGYPVTYPYEVVGETIPAGATMDAAVSLPATGTKSFPLYSRQLHLDNAGTPPGGMLIFLDPQPAAVRPAVATLTVGSLTASASGHRVRIGARTVGCSPCRASARLRVHGQWRVLLMSRSNGRWVATFRAVPSGRWAYQIRVKDLDRGIALASVRQSVRVS